MSHITESSKPLKFPPAPDPDAARALRRLQGHTTSPEWLPPGVWEALDELRGEQHRLRRQVADELHALEELAAKFRREDAQHAEALRQAQRDGTPTSPRDERTPPAARAAERTAVEERLWAGVQVFAEHADRIIEAVRAHEDEWLADLRSRLTPAQEKRRRAQQLLAEAKAEEFQLHKLGQWVQKTADDEAFGRQPVPKVEPVPARVSAESFAGALERPWHKRRAWNGARAGSAA